MVPLVQELTSFLRTNPDKYFFVASIGFAMSVTIMVSGMAFGALDFRKFVVSPLVRYSSSLLLLICIGLLVNLLPFNQAFIIAGAVSAMTFVVVGWLLWSEEIIFRLVSIMFFFKAGSMVLFTSGRTIPVIASTFPYLVPLTASGFLMLAIYLLILTYKKINEELSVNLKFMSLAQSISSGAQSASTEKELEQKVLDYFVDEQFWDGGIIYAIDRDNNRLEKLADAGTHLNSPDTTELAGSLSETVIQSKKPFATSSAYVTSVSSRVKEIHKINEVQGQTLILVPLLDRGKAEGVLILFQAAKRTVFPQELETLSSIGNIVGLAQANIRGRMKLEERATSDSLTGLGNRARFHAFCQPLIGNTLFSVMLFDLNDFKEINDVFGHSVGDQFLIDLARRLISQLPRQATAFRLGGDEFVVVYTHSNSAQNSSYEAEELSRLIKQPILIDDFPLKSSASIGVAPSSFDSKDSHELLRCADIAMYQAKKTDRHIAYYDEELDKLTAKRTQLLGDVERGIENNEFELFYQPILSLEGAGITKCEALLRWHHPKYGLMVAGEFMPLVESTPIIDVLTREVVRMAAQDIVVFRNEGIELATSINVSARNMVDYRLPGMIEKTMASFNVSSKHLQLEITETVLMRDLEAAQAIAKQLAELGYNIIIDDFGTGHSALAYLGQFPIAQVKIDKSFVLNMHADQESFRLIEAIIELIHKLDFKVTAEGVENQLTHEALVAMGCDFVQGYHYARPMRKADFVQWLNKESGNNNSGATGHTIG